jgi:tetratricopeptide (TPR) repeat protein
MEEAAAGSLLFWKRLSLALGGALLLLIGLVSGYFLTLSLREQGGQAGSVGMGRGGVSAGQRSPSPAAPLGSDLAALEARAAANPKDVEALLALGRAALEGRQAGKAIEAFERAIRHDPASHDLYVRLGELYAQRGLHLKAQEALENATRLRPDLIEAHQRLARLLWSQGQRDAALKAYERAASIKTTDGPFAEELGNVLRQAKRSLEAAEYFRSALSQGATVPAALLLALAETLKELKRYEEAERVLAIAVDHHADVGAFPILLGQVELEQGRWAEAKRLFEQALAKSPNIPEAYFGLGRIAFDQGDLKAARRLLTVGLRHDPYNTKALETLQAVQKH